MNTDKIYAQTLAGEYAPKDTSKVIALRKLDKKAKTPSLIFAYTYGIVMTLIAGTGMCLAMGVIGGEDPLYMIAGIIIGLIGFGGAAFTYPIFKKIRARGMKKYAFEIMELAKEIATE